MLNRHPVIAYRHYRAMALYRIGPAVMAEVRRNAVEQALDYVQFLAMNAIASLAQGWRNVRDALVAFRDGDEAMIFLFAVTLALYLAIFDGYGRVWGI